MSAGIRYFFQRLALILLVLAFWGSHESALAQDTPLSVADAYRLGTGDEISVRVVVWDTADFRFAELEALSGTYVVTPEGRVMVPLVGSIEALGLTTDELSSTLGDTLQTITGLTETPSVTIGIARYRPVFVLGDVAEPGEYPFQPGLRVTQLLALSGGLFRFADTQNSSLLRDGIRVAGSLREVEIDLATARIREARLLAETVNAEAFVVPEDIVHPEGPSAVAEITERETQLLETRRQALLSEVASLESSRDLLETEVGILGEKRAGLERQVVIMTEEVGNLSDLRSQGLLRSPNLINAQRALMDLEGRALDAENQVFRAQQSLGEIERDLNDVIQQRTTQVLNELQTLQGQIARLEVRSVTQQRVLTETLAEAARFAEANGETDRLVPVFRISRENGDEVTTQIVQPDFRLAPLDVLEVTLVPLEQR